MAEPSDEWRTAWEPLTPRGVAAFAGASLGRLLLAQLLVAMLAAASIGWSLKHDWFPVISDAIHEMPSDGGVTNGLLGWNGESPSQLAQNRYLSIAVDLSHSGELGRESHLQIEFGRDDVRIYSLLDYAAIEYPPGWNSGFNRTDLEPWWGAWSPWILITVLMAAVVSLLISWTVLATLYFIPIRIISFLENRDLNWRQSWLLAGAACMPGAFFLIAGIMAYSLGVMDLIRLGGIFALHFVIAWIYVFVAPLFCPRHPNTKRTRGNPFAAPKESTPSSSQSSAPQ